MYTRHGLGPRGEMWEDEFGELSLAPAPAQPLLLAHEDVRRNTAHLCKEREGSSLTLEPNPILMMQLGLSRQGSDWDGLDMQGLLQRAIRSC